MAFQGPGSTFGPLPGFDQNAAMRAQMALAQAQIAQAQSRGLYPSGAQSYGIPQQPQSQAGRAQSRGAETAFGPQAGGGGARSPGSPRERRRLGVSPAAAVRRPFIEANPGYMAVIQALSTINPAVARHRAGRQLREFSQDPIIRAVYYGIRELPQERGRAILGNLALCASGYPGACDQRVLGEIIQWGPQQLRELTNVGEQIIPTIQRRSPRARSPCAEYFRQYNEQKPGCQPYPQIGVPSGASRGRARLRAQPDPQACATAGGQWREGFGCGKPRSPSRRQISPQYQQFQDLAAQAYAQQRQQLGSRSGYQSRSGGYS